MKALIIREPWIGMILAGTKTWEMRGKPTSIRGRIGLIRGGSGAVCGSAELAGCRAALSAAEMKNTHHMHGIPLAEQSAALERGWSVPWELASIRVIDPPVPYRHPSGAVTWVNLEADVAAAIAARTDGAALSPSPAGDDREGRTAPAAAPELAVAWPATRVLITLTEGNIKNGHIYLRAAERLLPADAIGGPNKAFAAPRQLTVAFDPGTTVETDVAGDKMILRARGPVRDFLARSGARAGDAACIERLADHRFRITLQPLSR